jgi:tetrahydromethanopterin S-methyltransferase subunit H
MRVFVFKKEQQAFDFGGVTIGGQPGENPAVPIGGLFFRDQPIVESTKEGLFDKAMAKEWIDTGVMMSEETGHPLIIQIFGRTELAMERHLSWLVENYDGPFMFESVSSKARSKGVEYCSNAGLEERAIYNSVNLSMKEEEKEQLKNSPLDMAVVLGWSPRATSLPERMETIKSMIKEAEQIGIKRMVIDPAAMPVGAGYGLDYRTTLAVKSELGLPTCLAPDNAPSAWKFLAEGEMSGDSLYTSAAAAATAGAQLFAADCIMYGTMLWTKEMFTAIALIGNAISAAVAEAQHALGIDSALFAPLTSD